MNTQQVRRWTTFQIVQHALGRDVHQIRNTKKWGPELRVKRTNNYPLNSGDKAYILKISRISHSHFSRLYEDIPSNPKLLNVTWGMYNVTGAALPYKKSWRTELQWSV